MLLSPALFVGIIYISADTALTREEAAQMLYNAMNSHPLEVVEGASAQDGQLARKYALSEARYMVKAYGGDLGPGPDHPRDFGEQE